MPETVRPMIAPDLPGTRLPSPQRSVKLQRPPQRTDLLLVLPREVGQNNPSPLFTAEMGAVSSTSPPLHRSFVSAVCSKSWDIIDKYCGEGCDNLRHNLFLFRRCNRLLEVGSSSHYQWPLSEGCVVQCELCISLVG